MTNIYDLINDLYTDDEGWNTVLEFRYADQFLRMEAFRGATDDELMDIWQQVMYLMIYCGNTSYRIGELVMKYLKPIDEVAYVRFASVYRQFGDIGAFMEELKSMIKDK